MKRLLLIVLLLNATLLSAQKFSIKRLEIRDEKVYLYYDLLDTIESRTYTITLLSSADNFISPMQKVVGDLGLQIKPGYDRKIIWNAKEELGLDFDGMVELEVRGRLYIPFVQLDGFNKTFKRLSPTEITWTGGTQQNILNFDLYHGEEKIASFPNIANVGHYLLTIPTSIKPGYGYKFKITDSRNKDQIVFTPEFRVARRVPLLLKCLPLVAIGAGSYLALSVDNSNKFIPDPITP